MRVNGKKPIGVDLFAGAGGLSLGFEQAGFDVAAAVEYDPIHCATHEFNFPDCAAICRSVADIDGKSSATIRASGTARWTSWSAAHLVKVSA
jgi:DNA (cytosine-5)-methyltransferase 1